MLKGMPRLKTTISVDEDTLMSACELLGLSSRSEVVDVALDRLVKSERLLRDLRAYLAVPPTEYEISLGQLAVGFDLGDDEFDYDALYAV